MVAAPTVAAGLLNCGVLNRLKNSARNCKTFPSVMCVFLKSEKSTFFVAGPCRMFRPESPQVPAAAFVNAVVSNHLASVRSPLGSDPLPWPATSSALGVRPSPTPLDDETEKGKPSYNCTMPFTCQP